MSNVNLDELIEELQSVALRGGQNFVADFERVLAEIAKSNDAYVINRLSPFFDDKVDHDEAMFSIIHLIEKFDDRVYIERLLDVVDELYRHSPRWASIVFMRVLNSDAAKGELVRQLHLAPPSVKASVHSLMTKINDRSPKFLSKTAAILAVSNP